MLSNIYGNLEGRKNERLKLVDGWKKKMRKGFFFLLHHSHESKS